MNLAFMGAPGPFEILLILFVILLLFGARKLPELSRSLGRSLSEFKKGRQEGADSLNELKQDGVKLEVPDEKSGDDKDKPSD